jgi:hypothetical protein
MVRYDARREIMNSIGDLGRISVFNNRVLVAPYVPSGVMWHSGLGFPIEEQLSLDRLYELYDSKRGLVSQVLATENIYQGKVLLLLKTSRKEEQTLVGNWVFTQQENTSGISVCGDGGKKSRVLEFVGADYTVGWPCKIMDLSDTMGSVEEPALVA